MRMDETILQGKLKKSVRSVRKKKKKEANKKDKQKSFGNKNIQYFKILMVPIVDSAVTLSDWCIPC